MRGQVVPAETVRVVVDLLASGLNPMRAARVAGVSKSFAYDLDREVSGVSRLAVKQEAAARRAAGPRHRGMAPGRVRVVTDLLASGLNPMQAARAAGVPETFAYDLHRKMGGVYRPPAVTCSDRCLGREERYELARLHDSGLSIRQTGGRMGRSPPAICRELARNADPRTGQYQPGRAHRLAWERQRRPKPSRLSGSPVLCQAVQQLLDRRYSPEQVSGRLKMAHPDDEAMQVSHETICQSICLYPRGELRRELKACLRSGRQLRRPRGRAETRGRIIGAVPIGERPPEVEGRLVPGHHEGDLIMGSAAPDSAVGTIVERTAGYLTLLHLPHGHTAGAVADAVIARMSELPAWFAQTLTWDRGKELARRQRITGTTGISVCFAGPRSPWQRGSNENISGLLREYLPEGTDLSQHTAADLQHIAGELNDRPRKRFGYHTPREQLDILITKENERVATTP